MLCRKNASKLLLARETTIEYSLRQLTTTISHGKIIARLAQITVFARLVPQTKSFISLCKETINPNRV